MCELSSQAYDRNAGTNKERAFRFPDWARPIIINTETGAPCEAAETGLLRIIDLANVYSSIAIQTQDLHDQSKMALNCSAAPKPQNSVVAPEFTPLIMRDALPNYFLLDTQPKRALRRRWSPKHAAN